MLPPVVTTLWIAALLTAGSVMAWIACGPTGRPFAPISPGRLFVIFHLVLVGAGSVWLSLAEDRGAGGLLMGYALFSFGLGCVVASRLGLAPTSEPVPALEPGRLRLSGLAALAGVGLLALAGIALQVGLPFLTGDPILTRGAFAGLQFDLFRWFLPPAALVALGLALAQGGRRRWLLASIALGAVVLLEVLLASRALPFELAAAGLLLAFWSGLRLPRRVLLGLLAIAVVFFVGIQLARVAGEPILARQGPAAFAIERTINRVLLIHPRTLELLVEQIPSQEPYFAGSTYLRRVFDLLGTQDDRPTLGYWIYERLYPATPGGFAAPGVLGEAWANGGPFLALPVAFALGVAAQLLGRLTSRLPPTVPERVAGAVLAVAFARTYASSLNGFLATALATTIWWLLVSQPAIGWLRRLAKGARSGAGPAARSAAPPTS